MDTVIKAHVAVTYEDYKEFSLFGMFRKYKRTIPLLILYITVVSASIIYIVSYLVNNPTDYFRIALFFVLILFIAYRLIVPFYRIKVNYKKSRLFSGLTGTYVFTENTMNCQTASDISSGTGQYSYAAFQKVFETKTAFYLFISDRQALIIPKGNIFEGTAEGLVEILRKRVGIYIRR